METRRYGYRVSMLSYIKYVSYGISCFQLHSIPKVQPLCNVDIWEKEVGMREVLVEILEGKDGISRYQPEA